MSSSKNNKNIKNKNTYNKKSKNTLKEMDFGVVETVILAFLGYLSTFYLIYMHDMYFDITKTRTQCFIYGAAAFTGLAVLAYIIEMSLHAVFVYDNKAKKVSIKGIKDYFRIRKVEGTRFYNDPRFYAFVFVISQAAAALVNAVFSKKGDRIYKGLKLAVTGERGRRMGLMMMLVIFVVFMILAYQVKSVRSIYPILLFVSLYMFYIAVLQHFGTDFKGWRKEIKPSQKTIFVSTIGNMNTFGSYLCIFLAISLAVFIFTDKVKYKLMSGLGVFAGAFTIMTAKSDNVYLGTGIALVVLFYVSVRRKKLMEWTLSILVISSGLFLMSIIDKVKGGSKGHLNGVASLVGNPKIMGIVLAFAAAVFVILLVTRLINKELYDKFQCRQLIIGVTVAGILAVMAVVILGIKNNNELLKFNDRWGEYRGYIWKRSARVFKGASLRNKIFGHGNETVRDIMLTYYRDEMSEVTHKVYDSAHNVILQRLLTTGLFGCLAYLALVFSSLKYMLKNSEGSAEILACAAAVAAYFAEAMVDPEQPITTPLFYVIMAVGVGLVRYRKVLK